MSESLEKLYSLFNDERIEWSVSILDLELKRPVFEYRQSEVLKTASVPKVLLLHEISESIERGELDLHQPIDRRETLQVSDAGIWQHLSVDILPLNDVATFVAAYSDNLATNALIDLVGIDKLEKAAANLGLTQTRLNDYVRPLRNAAEHPVTVSQGSSCDLASFCADQELFTYSSNSVSTRLVNWLRLGVDYSMFVNDFTVDPLSHQNMLSGFRIWNKTGTDLGVRADVGIIEGSTHSVAYSLIANWTDPLVTDFAVVSTMRSAGEVVRDYVGGM